MQLSVIIPLKRREIYLHEVISSIPLNVELIYIGRTDINRLPRKSERKHFKFKEIHSENRAYLMNQGAKLAQGKTLLFLHPDTYLKKNVFSQIRSLGKEFAGGGVDVKFYPRNFALKLMALGSNLRMRMFGSIYGDQCMFVRKEIFEKLGGFKEMVICEDLEFSHRLRIGSRLKYFKYCQTSSRRFLKKGIFRQWWINQKVKFLYHRGESDKKLRRLYGK